MEKEFVPYTEALALKELGFDEDCFAIWSGFDELNFSVTDTIRLYSSKFKIDGTQSSTFYVNDFNSRRVSAPTFSQCFRWFREKHGLIYSIGHIGHTNTWVYEIINMRIAGPNYGYGETYEETELECLKKLIEIVKEKQL